MSHEQGSYYLPAPSYWPLVGSIGLFLTLGGFAAYLNGASMITMLVGSIILIVMLFGWFGKVIKESEAGLYRPANDDTRSSVSLSSIQTIRRPFPVSQRTAFPFVRIPACGM